LDYANSIMYGMSASNMHKLQSAQNSVTRVVLPSLRHLSASYRLSYIHWLPVHYSNTFVYICDAERFASAGHTVFTVKRGSSCDAADVLRCKIRMLMRYM